jgi:hypothetical protein
VKIGLVLDGTRKGRYEASRLAYLGHPAVEVRADLLITDAVAAARGGLLAGRYERSA